MSAVAFKRLVDDFLASEWQFHPVDASFNGSAGYDAALPPADEGAITRERIALSELSNRLDYAVPHDAGERLDHKLMDAQISHRLRMLDERPQQHNPAWATGEAAFGVISLLLREGDVEAALRARVMAIPDFLDQAGARLGDRPLPPDWVTRAKTECAALERLLRDLDAVDARLRERAGSAAARFAAALDGRESANPACGEPYLAFLMNKVHGFEETPAQLEARAQAAFDRILAELDEDAARIDPALGWREQIARLAEIGPAPEDVLPSYRRWNARAMEDAAALVTPASGYELDFRPLPGWAAAIAGDLYFLPYRSPRALAPGSGSTYWISLDQANAQETRRAHNTAAVKLIHAVHHGSIGHHTQNAAARSSPSKLARLAGTDCAAAIAFLSAGTMVEGWACYAEDLMAEVPGFYTPAELLQLKYFELRNIGCCLGDIRLHTGTWTLEEMRAFYRDEVNFAPSRIWSETTRNSIFPGSRLMYWTGVERIKAMRAASTLDTKTFHDRLLSFGAAPLAWISEELDRCA